MLIAVFQKKPQQRRNSRLGEVAALYPTLGAKVFWKDLERPHSASTAHGVFIEPGFRESRGNGKKWIYSKPFRHFCNFNAGFKSILVFGFQKFLIKRGTAPQDILESQRTQKAKFHSFPLEPSRPIYN